MIYNVKTTFTKFECCNCNFLGFQVEECFQHAKNTGHHQFDESIRRSVWIE